MAEPADKVDELVRAGVTAVKEKRRAEARALLEEAVARSPDHVQAWLWLSSVVETPQEREACLERALEIEPGHEMAQKGLRVVRERLVASSLEAGIAAAQAGDHEKARRLFMEAIKREDENLKAWLWMARVVDNPEDRQVCYENVLMLDPDNVEAREALAQLEADVAPEPEAPLQPEPEPVTEPETASPSQVDPWERLEEELRCPHCLAPTNPDARRCPECRKRLWVRLRRKEERSTGLWILIAIQLLQTLMLGVMALGFSFLINQLASGVEISPQVAALLEAQYGLSPVAVRALDSPWSNVLYLAVFLPFIFSALLLIGLYFRWPVIFYLLLLQAVLGFIFSVANFFLSPNAAGLVGTAIGVLFSLGYLLFVLRLEDDFLPERRRILLRLDRDVHEGSGFLRRGREYASREMWGLAALHFRHAAARMRVVDAYLALTIACLELETYGLAERALDEARAIAPHNPKVAEFTQLLEERR